MGDVLPVRKDTKKFFERQKKELAEDMNLDPEDITFDQAVRASVEDLPEDEAAESLRRLIGGP